MSYEKLDFAEPVVKERAPSPNGSVSSQATAIAEPSERTQDAEEERTEPSALDLGYSVKTWPVPQVIVLYKDRKIAMGRQAIMNIGHREFAMTIFVLWGLWRDRPKSKLTAKQIDEAYTNSQFAREMKLYGTFYAVHGKDDVGPVYLTPVGCQNRSCGRC
ncbi:hypothetical protein C8Q76DRAFT_790451 [Earliella scabrosa]|nr:hypothetical protein C8Q76DRAFT_790451 [Earliella scabrosa]